MDLMNVCVSENLCVKALIANVLVLGGGALGALGR